MARQDLEAEARAWIEAVLDERLGESSLQEELKDGVVLCRLVDAIKPGCCPKHSVSRMPFKQMENIGNYLAACTALGVPAFDTFQTVDLFENKDMGAVLVNIHSLGRVAQRIGYEGPTLGVKMSTAAPRQFTDAQLAEAKAAPNRLVGTGAHGRASLAGTFSQNKNIR